MIPNAPRLPIWAASCGGASVSGSRRICWAATTAGVRCRLAGGAAPWGSRCARPPPSTSVTACGRPSKSRSSRPPACTHARRGLACGDGGTARQGVGVVGVALGLVVAVAVAVTMLAGGGEPAGQPAAITAAVRSYPAGAPGWKPSADVPPARLLGDLAWQRSSRGEVAGLPVVAFLYRDLAGDRVLLLRGARPSPGGWRAARQQRRDLAGSGGRPGSVLRRPARPIAAGRRRPDQGPACRRAARPRLMQTAGGGLDAARPTRRGRVPPGPQWPSDASAFLELWSTPGSPSMTHPIARLLGYATVAAGMAAAGYMGLVTGACPIDLGIGRRSRPLGPQLVEIAAPRQVVFDLIAEPYLGRAPRALADKLRVLERGSDLVLAAHFTPLGGRPGLVAQTVETVRFTRPDRVDFRLVRGPVPHVVEAFVLTEQPDGAGTRLAYQGEIAADLWRLGQWWSGLVARRWEHTVAASLATVKSEAERRAAVAARQRHPGR